MGDAASGRDARRQALVRGEVVPQVPERLIAVVEQPIRNRRGVPRQRRPDAPVPRARRAFQHQRRHLFRETQRRE